MWPPGDPACNPRLCHKIVPKILTPVELSQIVPRWPEIVRLTDKNISGRVSRPRRCLLSFNTSKFHMKEIRFLLQSGLIFCISTSLALYTGWSFVSALISSIICPVAMKEYLHLALTGKGESPISHKTAIKSLTSQYSSYSMN